MNDNNIISAVKAALRNPSTILQAEDKKIVFTSEVGSDKATIEISIRSSFGEAVVDVIADGNMIGGWHYEVANEGDFDRYLYLRELVSKARRLVWDRNNARKKALESWFWMPNQTF